MNCKTDMLIDKKTGCYSVLSTLSLNDYLKIVTPAYDKKGGLDKQRAALTTKTAKTIRSRMVSDLKEGAILPPVVVGIILSSDNIEKIKNIASDQALLDIINNTPNEDRAIIDGMQRTTAMLEVMKDKDENYRDNTKLRVEFWIASSTDSLIYRMLVLNTGQVPWNLRRQVEVIFTSIIKDLKSSVSDLKIIEINDGKKITVPGQYHADDLIELFLAFGLRNVNVNVQEKIAEEFSRLDFIEATGNKNFIQEFKTVLHYLVKFDGLFSKFGNGRDIFTKQTARIGFVVAFARNIFGKPGIDRSEQEQQQNFCKLIETSDKFISRLSSYNEEQMETFLDIETLTERLTAKKGKIGEFDRELFLKAFEELINDFSINSLTSCWRAY